MSARTVLAAISAVRRSSRGGTSRPGTAPDGKPVPQFVSYDSKNINTTSFYTDGVESYREVYPPQAGEPQGEPRELSPEELFALAREMDVKMIACTMSMDAM